MKPGISLALRLPVLEVAFWMALASTYFLLPEHLTLLTHMLVFGLFAVSLDLALGYAGILTVGHAAFFGLGAYAAGLWAKHIWPEPISGLLAAIALCATAGYLLSYLIVRGADLTRLMITIGICVLLGETANRWSSITGGSDGLQGITVAPVFGRFEFDLWGRTGFVYSFVIVLAAFLLARLIIRSPFGLVLQGIQDNRKRMLAIGSPVDARVRLAYCFSAALAGLAGALLAHSTQFVGLDALSLQRSAEILVILVLGGMGRLYGGMLGAIVYFLIHDWLAGLSPEYWMFGLGAFLIAAALMGRGGIMGTLARLIKTGPH